MNDVERRDGFLRQMYSGWNNINRHLTVTWQCEPYLPSLRLVPVTVPVLLREVMTAITD